jgi:DnaJ-class molecular chaperone
MIGEILFGDHEDCYSVLGCTEHSTKEQITAEYRKKSLELHPDKWPGDEKRKEQWLKLKKAYDTLKDEDERNFYDKWRRAGVQVPYEVFRKMPLEAHQSIHWSPKEPAPVLIDYNTEEEQKRKRDAKKEQLRKYYELQNSDPNSNVNKFRNYHHI